MKGRFVRAAWVVMTLAGNAAADESGHYVSSGLGRVEMRDKSGLGHLLVDQDKDDSSWTLGLGYRFNPYFALDLGYVDLGELKARGHVDAIRHRQPVAGRPATSAAQRSICRFAGPICIGA